MSCFLNKVTVITGAGSGIGRELAIQVAQRGGLLALSDVNVEGLNETKNLLPEGAKARVYRVDVSQREEVFGHAEEVRRDFGTAHYVFNNAGTSLVGTFAHITIEEMEWQLNINLWGVIYGCKAFLPMMLEQREGCLINLSSVFGLVGFPAQGAYNISKFGVRGLTECLWSELDGTGVRAVSVHPGGIRTNIDKASRRAATSGEEEARFESFSEMLTTPPEECAARILSGVERRDSRILVGNGALKVHWLSRLFPNQYYRLIRAILR
ncbi:NAD(P)-dependent dehydrogenase (short-subunit alcohol dehydrogenase family) [Pseudomonas laurylsulfatiphila]|uniref:SDR family NAD(P)-dependent oxidoreductase n=1 Tax=Pseudomonas laurylsulfatiphila TaxID=2011015 RepID=UPI003D2628D1